MGDIGDTVARTTLRPTEYCGHQYTIEQLPTTNNYSFDGYTYISSSENGSHIEAEFPSVEGSDTNTHEQKTFELKEHFRYPFLDGFILLFILICS